MNGQLRKREEDEIRSIGAKFSTAQTDQMSYRQNNVRQEEVNQEPGTSSTAYNLKMPQQPQYFENKPLMFKSRYINDNGRWTQDAVNDGFVDIKDYIGDIKNDGQGISFNGKEMKISEDFEPEKEEENQTDNDLFGYEIDNGKVGELRSDFWENWKKADDERKYFKPRTVWRVGAELYLRQIKGYLTSAWMLEHSLQYNPTNIYRGSDSRVAYLINNDKAYLNALDKEIAKSKNGKINTEAKNITFKNGDLYYSIHNANIKMEGYKREDGKWIIKSTLYDVYDFTRIMTYMGDEWYEFANQAGLGTLANDAGVISQLAGIINPYSITIEFYTTR